MWRHCSQEVPWRPRELFGSSSGNIRLPNNRVRIPDAYATTKPEGLFVEQPVLVVEVLSPSTLLDVFALNDGGWEPLVRLDGQSPTGEVAIGEHGTVSVDLLDLLDG